jgi:hypothetical protein
MIVDRKTDILAALPPPLRSYGETGAPAEPESVDDFLGS